jgi:endogenous inhibitor of DNA gyrase (YacG/DUF329 family)
MKSPRRIKCPTCKEEGEWFGGKYGPFCSHRCKLIDLGKWFSEENRVSEPLRPEHLGQVAEVPPDSDSDQAGESGQDSS